MLEEQGSEVSWLLVASIIKSILVLTLMVVELLVHAWVMLLENPPIVH
jgi:hypothetical protein